MTWPPKLLTICGTTLATRITQPCQITISRLSGCKEHSVHQVLDPNEYYIKACTQGLINTWEFQQVFFQIF